MNQPELNENDIHLISHVLTILDGLNNLVVKAAASPMPSGKCLANDEDIQKKFSQFEKAYESLPKQVTESVNLSFSPFNRLLLDRNRTFDSQEFTRLYVAFRRALELKRTVANEELKTYENDAQMIFRNLQISIDSSIVPLHQTEIPNFEENTKHVKPFNKANYMYKSINTLKDDNNFLKLPIDLLFRPSTYSLFSHILFNANRYAKIYSKQVMNTAFYHIVTGTPGIGKSAIRMPLIALTLSLGVNEIKTARKGEPSFIFLNRNPINHKIDRKTNNKLPVPCDFVEQSNKDSPLAPIGGASITINRKNRQPERIHRDTFCYTYDVIMSLPLETEEETYNPQKLFSSQIPIGQLMVPSIHFFPHFFKLFVNHKNQIENRLRGSKWHIVDEYLHSFLHLSPSSCSLILHGSNIPDCEHVVLLTSPVKERWEKITLPKQEMAPTILYNVPTLLFPEVIHMFNAIPCPNKFDTTPHSMMMRAQHSICKQGMIPMHVFNPLTVNSGPVTSHRYIHSSSPQFDPMNWFTQHATHDSLRIVQQRTTRRNNEAMELNLASRGDTDVNTEIKDAKHERFYLSAVEKGLKFLELRQPGSLNHSQMPVLFPKTQYCLLQIMSAASSIERVTLPDPETLHKHEARAYNPRWNYLFEHCLHQDALSSILPPIEGFEEPDTDTANVTGKRRLDSNQMQVITTHLVPDCEQNTGFDSILLMFRRSKTAHVLHSLGVFFLQGKTGSTYDISDDGVHLMKKWCSILSKVYSLKRVQIFPSFIVPKDELHYHGFQLNNTDKLRSFIPEQNIWIAQFETTGDFEVGDVRKPPMTASSAPILARYLDLAVSHNPHAVRCAYCGLLVTENFPDHYCSAMNNCIPAIKTKRKLIGDLDRSSKQDIESTEERIHLTIHIPPSEKKNKQKGKKTHPQTQKEEEISVDFVSDPSVLQHKKVNGGLRHTEPSPSHQKDYLQITHQNELPGNPDVYRFPLPPLKSAIRGTESTPNDDIHHAASTQSSSRYLSDQSEIVEAHCIWTQRRKLSYVRDDSNQYRPIQLAEQLFKSLQYDLPTFDITHPTHNAQFMLPAGANAGLYSITVRLEEATDPLRSKRIEYESYWQLLNRKAPPGDMSVALQADELMLIRRIQNCGDAIMKSHLTCLLAKGLLLRSRLAIQTGDLQRARIFLVQSKQHMELNDTAEVECEFMHALGKDSKAVSSLFDELKMVTASARSCFGRNWEQWIQGGQNLPILLNPVFYTLQSHLQQIQDYVIGFRWYLGILRGAHSIDMQQTNQSQWATMENDLLELLNEGLSLQLRIAWRTGNQNRVAYFQRELNSSFKDDGDMKIQAMTTQFKSREEQIEELNIDDMTKAFEYIYDTTRQYCNSMKAIARNDSTSQTPIPTIVQQDIRVNPQLIIDRISELIDACHQKLQKPGNEKIITRLFMVLLELSSLGTTNSILDADTGTVEEKETCLHEETGIEIGEDHKKRKRGYKTDRGQYDSPSKPDKRPSTDPSQSMLPVLHVDQSPYRRELDHLQYFRNRFGPENVVNVRGDGNCWLYAIFDQLTDDDLERASINVGKDLGYDAKKTAFVNHIRPRLVEAMWADIDEFRRHYDDSDQLSPEEYIERQRDDGQWGGYHEFPYLSRILQKRIAVYSPNVITPHVIGDDPEVPKINIGFCNKNHFISLHNVPEDVQPEDTESLSGEEEEETEREEMEREAAEQAEEKREDSEGGKLRIQPHRHAKPKVFAGGKTQRKK